MATLLERAKQIKQQQKSDSNKIYSMHAPEVECIAKGKVNKRYEFGCKVVLVTTSLSNWIHRHPCCPWQSLRRSNLERCDRADAASHRDSTEANRCRQRIPEAVSIIRLTYKSWSLGLASLRACSNDWSSGAALSSRSSVTSSKTTLLKRNYLQGDSGDCINAFSPLRISTSVSSIARLPNVPIAL